MNTGSNTEQGTMRRDLNAFVRRVLAFTGLLVLLLALNMRLGARLVKNDYMAAMIDKSERLAHLASPRIVVIGGSNSAFGLDGEELEKAFHRPVVNMSMHGGLGFEFMVNSSIDLL